MKTEIQEALHQFMIPHMKGKPYSEKMKIISEMQEFLEGIKNALIADATYVHCEYCNYDSKAINWNTVEEELDYETNLNKDYDEEDKIVRIISTGTFGICPYCKKKKLINEKIKKQIPQKTFF